MAMKRGLRVLAAAGSAILATMGATGAAFAQKPGGVLRMHALDSPPRKLAEDAARPIIFYNRFAYC
jgi:hypothetical protein